jgi:hypothetical protein
MQSEPLTYLRLNLEIAVPHTLMLEGIEAWFAWDLISELDLHWRDNLKYQNRLVIVAKVNDNILLGLDLWLRMGLITDEYTRLLGRNRFSRDLPDLSDEFSGINPIAARSLAPDKFVPAPEHSHPQIPLPDRHPSLIGQMVQSLISEFSTVWLLFLGVFLVVVSSGVLAASQWNQFPPQGQFAILLIYTIAFWGVSIWTGRQENLSLTTRTLEVLTLLVVPVNFWAIDGFQLLKDPVGLIESAIAVVILSSITLLLLKQHGASKLTALNCVGLSLLHIGWGTIGYPLIAVYIGTVGTSAIFLWQQRGSSDRSKLALGEITIAYTTVILLFRAISIAGVNISDLGLAFSLCGWMLSKLNRRQNSEVPQLPIAAGLLWLGWGVSVGVEFPWQAATVSILALFLLGDRLQRYGRGLDLAAIFLITLQTIYLSFQLLPLQLRTDVTQWGMTLARTDSPLPLLGVVIFPYIILTLVLSDRLRHSERHNLANLAETLSLGLGTMLTCLSFISPVTRSLNLGLSFITLFIFTVFTNRRNSEESGLIYLTHIVGLGAIAATADLLFPNFKFWDWAFLSLGLGVIELVFSAITKLNSQELQIWRKTSWELGMGLIGLSYAILILDVSAPFSLHRILWAIAPLTLTTLGFLRNFPQASQALNFSIISLFLFQILTFPHIETRAIGLGTGTVLMLINSLKYQKLAASGITVGFALSLIGTWLWQFSLEYQFSDRFILFANTGAIAVVILLAIRHWLKDSEFTLPRIYSQAFNGWAIALTLLILFALTIFTITNYVFNHVIAQGFLPATSLIVIAMLYRSIIDTAGWAVFLMGWGLELLVVSLSQGSLTNLAIANIGLGLSSQLVGDLWLRRKGWTGFPIAWHLLPIFYGILGVVFRLNIFTAWTGFASLGTALIGIGIGRRKPEWKGLTYLALVGVTISIYELVIYQLSLSTGGSAGDGVVILAIVATVISIAYQLFSSFLTTYLRMEPWELKIIGHIHWSIGAGLTVLSAFMIPSQIGGVLGTCVAMVLAIYALLCGRNLLNPDSDFWIYAGIAAVLLSGTYLLYFAFPQAIFITRLLRPTAAAIACLVCVPIYLMPWGDWGWRREPWQRSAIGLPFLSAISTSIWISTPSLFLVAAFYSWVAKVKGAIRISYISLGLINWALMQFYQEHQLNDPLWYITTIGFSLLFVVQVEPTLSNPEAKDRRHLLRLLGTGSIAATAAIQSFDNSLMAWIAIGIGLAFILAGLSLRVRSYLYVGTLTFVIEVFIQVSIFVTRYSLLIWALGIFAGILFIWIAANFEARRDRILTMMQNIMTELQAWE